MAEVINVYCDESCHLATDGQGAMVLGAIWCPDEKKKEIAERIKEIRQRHRMPPSFEFKWTKIGPSKVQMYMDLVDYFFDDDDVHFRCLVVPDKSKIDHESHNQTHDEWYYKMYFTMLKVLLKPGDKYRIYLDIKDTRSNEKVKKLHEILCNNAFDFSRNMIQKVQQIRSHEVVTSQIADVLIGAMSYKSRGKSGDANSAKATIVDRIQKRSGYTLQKTTLYKEDKFNILVWQAED
jgi:hypothetical protein